MKAVIMAGGEGTRLRPLTSKMPKPLAKILGESTLCHIIRLLKKHDIRDAATTLMFMPDEIKTYIGNEFENVNLQHFIEDIPLGTAGSVKNTNKFLLDEKIPSHEKFFMIISGDAVCDIDIKKARAFHINNNAEATIVLTRSKNPLEFGGVMTEDSDSGRIASFIEKPAWSQVFTDTINTGIYIINNDLLKLIPDKKFYDFGRDFFPLLLREKHKLFGYIDENYWCDIGDIDAYYKCNTDALDGNIGIIKSNENFKRIKNKIFTDKNNVISETVKIKNHCIIGQNCEIKNNTEIDSCIIGDNVKIGLGVKLKSSIICDNAEIGDNVIIKDRCVVGRSTKIGNGSVISPGVKIWDNQNITEYSKIMDNIVFSGIKKEIFEDYGIKGRFNESLPPSYCVKIGNAAGMSVKTKTSPGRIGVMYSQNIRFVSSDPEYKNRSDKNNAALLIKNSLLCGICSSGAKSYDFGEGFESLAAFAAGHFSLDIMFFIDREIYSDDSFYDTIKIYDKYSVYPSRIFERKFDAALNKEDARQPPASDIYETEIFDGIKFLYFSELIKSSTNRLDGMKIKFKNLTDRSGTASHIIKKALTELGAQFTESELEIEVDDDGKTCLIEEKNGRKHDFWHIAAILMYDEIKKGKNEFFMPYIMPHSLQLMAQNHGAVVNHYLSCSFEDDNDDIYIKSRISETPYLYDAGAALVKLLGIMHIMKKSISDLFSDIPEFNIKSGDINVEEEIKTSVINILNKQLRQIKEEGKKTGCSCEICRVNSTGNKREGIKLDYLNGIAQIIPSKTGKFRIIAESFNMETADEIFYAAEDRIKAIIDGISNEQKK